MNSFFRTQYSQEDLQQRLAQRRNSSRNAPPPSPGGNGNGGSNQGSMVIQQANDDAIDMTDLNMMGGGDSLDDIIMQNNKELQRRQSLPRVYENDIDRRASMMEFGSSNQNLNEFQFGATTGLSGDSGLGMRRQSTGELEMTAEYGNIGMPGQQFSMGIVSDPLTIDTSTHFSGMSADMVQTMMGYAPMGMEGISEEDSNALNMFSPASFSGPFGPGTLDSMTSDFMMPQGIQDGLPQQRDSIESEEVTPMMPTLDVSDSALVSSPQNMSMTQSLAYNSPVLANMSVIPTSEPFSMPAPTPSAVSVAESDAVVKIEKKAQYTGIYSSSGFDMLGALMKVATRKNPEIDIGKVDLSCAFVVCDVTMFDCPIIYASDIFERLTGYSKHEIVGQNCRFLQSPEGKIQAGARRQFVNNDDVYYLRERIAAHKEAQRSIINYRKGGQPFMNCLTMIPITGEDSDEIKYFVGFQIDLLMKPQSLEAKSAGGVYTIDYSQGTLPRYVWQPPEGIRSSQDAGGQTVSRDDVSQVLSAINTSNESEITRRMWDKILLENTDDVVHVLSLKGLFLYLSPSSRHVLEYDSSELVGTALSSVCHPSDIVPVTRELKDTSTGAAVNVVFRIRRKKSGYTWFESHGSLCVEQGKGRKCIILVGRERPVYALARHDIEAAGGMGESEMWTKISTSGMFLFVSSNVRTLLDRAPDDLVGTSIQQLMRPESKVEFGRSLEKARTGMRVTHKHEILNKRGLVLQAQTTLYPGDAAEGSKPTFLVAQTRLLKTASRTVPSALLSHVSSSKSPTSISIHPEGEMTPISHPPPLSSEPSSGGKTDNTSGTSPLLLGPTALGPITQAGGARLTIGSQDAALASEDNIFEELKTTRCTSWQFELRQMEKSNRILAEELAALLQNKKKRKRRKGGSTTRDCANCHTRVTPEWRRGPSGNRDLCNSCGLRWAKQTGRVSPRTSTKGGDGSKHSASPIHNSSPLQNGVSANAPSTSNTPNLNFDKGNGGDVAGSNGGGVTERRAAITGSLGGRTTMESMPVHAQSVGFREGGERGIVRIREEGS